MTNHPSDLRNAKLGQLHGRRPLLERRELIEDRLATVGTVGDVWRINDQLAAIDTQLEAT